MKVKDIKGEALMPPLKALALRFLREGRADEVYTLAELAFRLRVHIGSLRLYTPAAEFRALRVEVGAKHFYGSAAAIKKLRGKLENQ